MPERPRTGTGGAGVKRDWAAAILLTLLAVLLILIPACGHRPAEQITGKTRHCQTSPGGLRRCRYTLTLRSHAPVVVPYWLWRRAQPGGEYDPRTGTVGEPPAEEPPGGHPARPGEPVEPVEPHAPPVEVR